MFLMGHVISRWNIAYFRLNRQAEVSTVRHSRARLWPAWSAAQPWRADPQTIWRYSQWEESGVQKNWCRVGSADFRRTMQPIYYSLAANWSAACHKLHQAKWRSDRQWFFWWNMKLDNTAILCSIVYSSNNVYRDVCCVTSYKMSLHTRTVLRECCKGDDRI